MPSELQKHAIQLRVKGLAKRVQEWFFDSPGI